MPDTCPKTYAPKECDKKTDTQFLRKLELSSPRLQGRYQMRKIFLCNKCRCMCQYHSKQRTITSVSKQVYNRGTPSSDGTEPPFSSPSIPLPFPSMTRGHTACCICRRPGSKLVVCLSVRPSVRLSVQIVSGP